MIEAYDHNTGTPVVQAQELDLVRKIINKNFGSLVAVDLYQDGAFLETWHRNPKTPGRPKKYHFERRQLALQAHPDDHQALRDYCTMLNDMREANYSS